MFKKKLLQAISNFFQFLLLLYGTQNILVKSGVQDIHSARGFEFLMLLPTRKGFLPLLEATYLLVNFRANVRRIKKRDLNRTNISHYEWETFVKYFVRWTFAPNVLVGTWCKTYKLYTRLLESLSTLSFGSLKFLKIYVDLSGRVWVWSIHLYNFFAISMNLRHCFWPFLLLWLGTLSIITSFVELRV